MADIDIGVTLDDGISAPAKSGASALEQVFAKLNAVANALSGADSGMGRLASQMSTVQRQANATAEALSKMTSLSAKPPSLAGVETAIDRMNKTRSNKMRAAMTEDASYMSKAMHAASILPFALRDKGPVKSTGGFGKAVQIAGEMFGDKGANGLMSAGKALSAIDSALGSVGLSLGGVVTVGAIAAAAAIMAIVAAIGAVVVGLGTLAVKGAIAFTSMAVQAGRFREDTLVSLEAMLKSGTEARKVFDMATKFAASSPFETNTVISAYKGLLAGGFGVGELDKWMGAIGDIATVKGADSIPQIIRGLSRLRSEGKLTGETLEVLRDSGLNMKRLAAAAGVTDVSKLIGLDGKKAEEAILKTIQDSFGGASKAAGGTLTGMLSTLASQVYEVFYRAFSESEQGGTGVSALFGSIKEAVKSVLDFLSGEGGKRLTSIVNQLGGGLSTVFGKFDANAAVGAFGSILAVIETIMPYLTAFLGGFGEGFQTALVPLGALLRQLTGKGDTISALAEGFRWLGVAIGFVVGMAVPLAVMFAGAIVAAVTFVAGILSMAASIVDAVTSIPGKLGEIPSLVRTSLEGLPDAISSAFSNAFMSAWGAVTSLAAQLGSEAAAAFSAAFRPALDLGGIGASLLPGGGMGATMASAVPDSGFMPGAPTAPPIEFNWGSTPQANSSSNVTTNAPVYNISLSGLGLDLPALVSLITQQITATMKAATGT